MSIPRDFGAHGRPASHTGSNGMPRTVNDGLMDHGEAKEGGPSPMPADARSGAFMPDESVREYTGSPRDAAGSYGRSAAPNPAPSAGNVQHGRVGKR